MSTVPFHRSRPAPLPPDIAKKLPSNIDAERCILGSILADSSALKPAREALSPDDFFFDQNKRIFRNMLFLADSQHPIDIIPLLETLERNGEIEQAGGEAYLGSLMSGMPRIANVAYYAKLVKEKATLRCLIHATQQIQQEALASDERTENIVANAATAIAAVQKPKSENPAVVVGFQSLLTMEMPNLEYAIEPLLTTGGTGEIYAWRGTGKSFLSTEIAYQLSNGAPTLFAGVNGAGGNWPVKRAYRVLYVYGEMHGSMIQTRAQQIAAGHGADLPSDAFFGVMCKDFQKAWRPNIATPRNRQIIEERIFAGGYEIAIFDNISTLWPTSQEGEGDRSAILSEWFMDLNQRGVCVIYLHHAGKSGEQRGSSEKEDMLDFVLRLRRPANYKHDQQLRVEVSIEKVRGECKQPRWLMPFEISLVTDRGAAVWATRPAREAQLEAAFSMFANGMKPGEVWPELGISRSTAFRYKKWYDQNTDSKTWIDRED